MEIQRERSYEVEIYSIDAEKQNGASIIVAGKSALEILSSNPDGKFKASEESTRVNVIHFRIEEGDELAVKYIRYLGVCRGDNNHRLSFDEYVEMGRPKKISVKEKLFLQNSNHNLD